jgi:hypothetical protein
MVHLAISMNYLTRTLGSMTSKAEYRYRTYMPVVKSHWFQEKTLKLERGQRVAHTCNTM